MTPGFAAGQVPFVVRHGDTSAEARRPPRELTVRPQARGVVMCTAGSVKWNDPRGGFGVKYRFGRSRS